MWTPVTVLRDPKGSADHALRTTQLRMFWGFLKYPQGFISFCILVFLIN